ncbi:MAG TPA: PKD domain-containing protein [Armatimonadota bacterium]|jgi:PKD repeat protein
MLQATKLPGIVLAGVLLAIIVGCGGGSTSLESPPPNTAPTARFTVTPATGTTATSFAVDAAGCTDPQDPMSALMVQWDWESNGTWTSYAAMKTANHTFATVGTHTITCRVKDSGGMMATTTQNVTVTAAPPGNTAPTASFTLTPSTGTTATSFAVDAAGSSDAQDAASALQVQWDWVTNGTWTTYTTTKTASHTFATAGTYTITLRVQDSGGLTATVTKQVVVTTPPPVNTAPVASFTVTPASGTTTTSFAVNASGSTDAQDAVAALQVQWDWDNTGTWTALTTTKTANHTYASAGTYTIALRVQDSGGLTNSTTHSVTVTSPPSGPLLTLALDSSLNSTGTTKATSITGAELLNTSGSVVSTATISGGTAQFALTGLTTGTYFIRVNSLADDLVPTKIDSVGASMNQYVGSQLNSSAIGTLASPTYRIKTFSLGQSRHAVVKYSSGAAVSPAKYAYSILTMSTPLFEVRVLGTGALLSSQGSGGPHTLSTWMMGSSNHGSGSTSNCSGCHGTLTTKASSYGSIGQSNGWCYKCHYGSTGTSTGMVDPAQ